MGCFKLDILKNLEPKLTVIGKNSTYKKVRIVDFLTTKKGVVDYYPFGMVMPGRNGNTSEMRYGYQGSEKDNEIKGNNNSYTTHFRQLDPRLGRWLSLDPKASSMPWQSPYCSMDSNPIWFNDPMGDLIIYSSNNSKKFNRRVKTRLFVMRYLGSKGLRQRIKAVQKHKTEVITIHEAKGRGSGYSSNTNDMYILSDKKKYNGLRVSKKSDYIFVKGHMATTIANEISHAEDDVNGNTQSGNEFKTWPDHTETIPKKEAESNDVENMARGLFFKKKRSNSHYSVKGSENWTKAERKEFRHIVKEFGKDKKVGQKLVNDYIKNGENNQVKRELKIWAQ